MAGPRPERDALSQWPIPDQNVTIPPERQARIRLIVLCELACDADIHIGASRDETATGSDDADDE